MSSETTQQVEKILRTWTSQLDKPSPNNPEMAKLAVQQCYQLAKKPEPFHIFWCESPLQMAVVPSVLSNVINSSRWDLFQSRLNDLGDPNSQKWKELWEQYFPAIFDEIAVPIANRIVEFQFPGTSTQPINRALHQVMLYLRMLAMDGRINRDNLYCKKLDRKSYIEKNRLFSSPFDAAHWQHATRFRANFENRTNSHPVFTQASVAGWMMGVVDERVVATAIPFVKNFVQPSPEMVHSQERVNRLREKFTEFERRANQRSAWYSAVLMGRPRTVPQANFEDGVNVRSVLENGYRTWKAVTDEIANEPRGNSWAMWGVDSSWLPFGLSCRLIEPELVADMDEEIDCRALLYHAAAGYLFAKNLAFVCAKPQSLIVNESGQPHNTIGPAATWSDGFNCYSYKGTAVPWWFIEVPERITLEGIRGEQNTEYRRVMISIFGEERFILESGAKIIHEDETGQLFQQELTLDEPLTMVRVKNSTPEPDGTYRYYFLRVPPDMVRARQAVAWTFGVEEKDYVPSRES